MFERGDSAVVRLTGELEGTWIAIAAAYFHFLRSRATQTCRSMIEGQILICSNFLWETVTRRTAVKLYMHPVSMTCRPVSAVYSRE